MMNKNKINEIDNSWEKLQNAFEKYSKLYYPPEEDDNFLDQYEKHIMEYKNVWRK